MFKNMHYWLIFIFCWSSLEAKTVYRLTAKIDQEIDYQSAALQFFNIGSKIRVSNSNNGQFVDLEVVKHSEQPGVYLAAATFSLLDATVGMPLIVTLLQENTRQTFDEMGDIRGNSTRTAQLTEDHIQLQLPEGEYRLPLPPLFSDKQSNSLPKPNSAPLYTTPTTNQQPNNEVFINRTRQSSSSSQQEANTRGQEHAPRSPLLNNQSRSYANREISESDDASIPATQDVFLGQPQRIKDYSSLANPSNLSRSPLEAIEQQTHQKSSNLTDNRQVQSFQQFFDRQESDDFTPPALSIPAQPQSSIQQLQPSMSSQNSTSHIKIPLQKQLSSPSLAPSLQSPPEKSLPWNSPSTINSENTQQRDSLNTMQEKEASFSSQKTLYFVQTGAYQRIQGVKDFLKLYHDIYPYKLEKVKKQPKRLIRCLLGPFELIEAQQVQKALKRKKRESFIVQRL